MLAVRPDLAAKGLSTISLRAVLSRLESVLGLRPISAEGVRRLVEVRNGAAHAGTALASRDVLVDCLTIAMAVLPRVELDEEEFFGVHATTARALVSEHKSLVSARIAARIASAKAGLRRLSDQLGEPLFTTVTGELASRRLNLDADEFVDEGQGVDVSCPACGATARLIGHVEVHPEVDFDVEPMGGGHYESITYSYWQPELHPQACVCTVCGLHLLSPSELAETGVPFEAFDVPEEDLGPDFDIQPLIEAAMFDGEE